MKRNKKIRKIIASVVIMVLSFSIMTGSTFAIFTGGDNVDLAVKSGKIDVTATVDKTTLKAYSKGVEQTLTDENGNLLFENGGSVSFTDEGDLVLDCITPGDRATFEIKVVNASNIAIMYRVIWSVEGELVSALVATANDESITNGKSEWATWNMSNGNDYTLQIAVELPYETDFNYQDKTATISYSIEAVQGNADIPDEWDGTADVSWYNEEDTEFTLSTAEQIAGLASLVNGNVPSTYLNASEWELPVSFEGKTVKLDGNVDFGEKYENGERVSFAPIGDTKKGGVAFKGTFDGQGYTISNLYQSGWAFGYEWGSYGSLGLFSNLEGATVKNLNISGMEVEIEGGDVSFIAGSATGNCTFENITIENSSIGTYNNGCGGIIGWSGEGEYTFKNITLGSDVVLGGLWGSFDSSIGGIVGQAEVGATYNFENVDIACRIDAYNDCTASYDYYNYRMCGMVIGRLEATTTIDGSNYPDLSQYNLTFNNVKVTYGKWSQYHYCRGAGRAKRVEAGYAYGGIGADYDHTTCTSHCMELIPFDQLFGGDQFGVKGLKSHEDIVVVYDF